MHNILVSDEDTNTTTHYEFIYMYRGITEQVHHDHTQSWCVARQSFWSNLIRKCGILYENQFIFMRSYQLHSNIQKFH